MFEAFRDSVFAVLYIMTEQSNQDSQRRRFESFRRCLLYLIDAGQICRAIMLPEFGWNSSIRTLIGKFDFFTLIFDSVIRKHSIICEMRDWFLLLCEQ